MLMNFWSMETPLSKRLFPVMSEVYNTYRDSNFLLIGVCMDSRTIESLQEYAGMNQLSYPVMYPISDAIYRNYGIVSAGTSILIDRKGNIVGRFDGNPGLERIKRVISLFL